MVALGLLMLATGVLIERLKPWTFPENKQGSSWLQSLLPFLGLGFLGSGGARLLDAWRVVRVLAMGDVVFAKPQPHMFPGKQRLAVAIASVGPDDLMVRRPSRA